MPWCTCLEKIPKKANNADFGQKKFFVSKSPILLYTPSARLCVGPEQTMRTQHLFMASKVMWHLGAWCCTKYELVRMQIQLGLLALGGTFAE